jgi:glycosyltransferase involved in cell wall biosynthesis
MKITAVIPCYNEAPFIENIVYTTRKYVDLVVVADDNSDDQTIKLARNAGAYVVLNNPKERGTGRNTRLGIKVALHKEADIVVTLDGDGQHDPDEIPKLLKCMTDNNAGLVIGSRFLGFYELPRYRKLGIDFITWLYNLGRKQKITDGQSGFRVYSKELLNVVEIDESGFGFSVETLIKARAMGFKICEVPVSCIYHNESKFNSTINPLLHGFQIVRAIIKWQFIKKK